MPAFLLSDHNLHKSNKNCRLNAGFFIVKTGMDAKQSGYEGDRYEVIGNETRWKSGGRMNQ